MTSITTRSSASAPASAERPRRERQTRLQEHLRTVKPGSRSASPGNGKKSVGVSASASKTVPKSLAAASGTPSAAAENAEQTSITASGRPKRRAAAKAVMHHPADSSSDQDDAIDEITPQETSGPSRATTVSRTPKKRSPIDSDDEDLAPSIRSGGRSSTGRKMPAQQVQQHRTSSASPSPSKKRAREPSGSEIRRLNEVEVQDRLAREKAELMANLAPLGIVPQDHVLDEALRAMSKSNTQFTVDSFIRTLASLDTNVSPLMAPRPTLSVTVPPEGKNAAFSTLESPSTPSSLVSPSLRQPSPSQAALSSAAAAPVAVPGLFYASPVTRIQGAAPARGQMNPLMRPGQHLGSLSRSFSAPVLPTLGNAGQMGHSQPTPASSASLFGASVAGMGRVATRRGPFGAAGSDSRQAPEQPTATSSPTRSTHVSSASSSASTLIPSAGSLLPAFAIDAAAAKGKPASPGPVPSTPSSSRLSKLQSWLAQDDEGTSDDDEDDSKSGRAVVAGAEAVLKAAVASSKIVAAVDAPAHALVDALPSDDERVAETRRQVGGKSVQRLRQRRVEGEQPSHTLKESYSLSMTTRRRASAKGKARTVTECLCGATAENSAKTVACVDCDVPFHLACLGAVSASQLASPWTCSRCVVARAEFVVQSDKESVTGESQYVDGAAEQLQAGTPKLADKRVRIGTNSTPHVYQEPTLVASTPVSAPRGNDFSDCADVALAPSPTASPVRRFLPTSPVPSAGRLPIPITPRLGEAVIQRAPGDYSPTSPQNYRTRAGRTRMVSGGAFLNSEWLNASWDSPGAATTTYGDAEAPRGARATTPIQSGLVSLVNEDGADQWHLPSWSDVTMTPSRALTSSATPGLSSSASSSVWDTPFAHASPHVHLKRANSSYHAPSATIGHFRAPSQDFLAALERDGGLSATAQHAPAETFAQRLFGGDQPLAHGSMDGSSHGHSSPAQRLSSPLNPRRLPPHGSEERPYAPQSPSSQHYYHHHHYRQPSLGDGLANPWTISSAVAHERMALSASMKPSLSAPGTVRFPPVHGGHPPHEAAAVEQQLLDDLLV